MPSLDKATREKRLWWKELELAGKREKTWREKAEKVVKRYRGEEKKKNRFNVLWANTETLRPAIYNSRPNPDVRRRFRDTDPVGKAVSELLERGLMVVVDYECTDQSLKNDVLDGLLVGRGVSRIRYIPSLRQVGEAPKPPTASTESSDNPDESNATADSETQEEVEYEQVVPEHVSWKDIRFGYARTWDEMPHLFFRHKLTRPDGEKKFGAAVLKQVKFAVPTGDDTNKRGEEVNETERVAEFWECWDKNGSRVFFLQEECDQLLFPVDNPTGAPPLDLSGFFPIPEPLRIVENTDSFEPIIPFSLYEEQADQLDKISARIDNIVGAMRLRGVYDSKMKELADLMSASDNDLIPVQSAQAYIDGGGLEKAIAWFPTEKAAEMLTSLYEARDRHKAIIDELTGISDIIRGATDPDETRGAQELKQTNYSVRLSRMQKEVQRYCKDLLRLASEVMAEKFAPETFTEMTELQFPTAQQKQMALAQVPPPIPGQPPPPPNPMAHMPTWEDILQVLHSDGLRRFKVDVETDSTIAATLNSDMSGMAEVLKGIGELLQLVGPLVANGSLPIDAAKELVMAVVRRAKMGMAVEDAFDKMRPPAPPPPPEAVQVAQIKAQTDKDTIAVKAQADIAKAQGEQQAQAQSRQAELQMETQKAQMESQIELQKDAQLKEHERALKQMEFDARLRETAMQLENERLIADAGNQTKIMVAEISAGAAMAKQASQQQADAKAQDKEIGAEAQSQDKEIDANADAQAKELKAQEAPLAADYKQPESEFIPVMKELIEHLKKPRRIMREGGQIVGLQ